MTNSKKDSKIKAKSGDLFIIDDVEIKGDESELIDGKRIGKIIFFSERYKDMMGFLFSKSTYNSIDQIKEINNFETVEYDNIILFTSKDIIEKDKIYELIGYNSLVTQDEVELTRRRIANHIYLLDEEVKMCDDEDYTRYYQQGYGGYASAVDTLNNLKAYRKNLYPVNHPLHIE